MDDFDYLAARPNWREYLICGVLIALIFGACLVSL